MTLKLYIAGPLFTPYHRGLHARHAARLRSAGYVCLVPHERGYARAFTADTGVEQRSPAVMIFDEDYDMVAEADAIVALLDDPDVSSGLTCEIGIFQAMMQHDPHKRGVLGLLTDDRAWRRWQAGMAPIDAFALGCILESGAIYDTLDDLVRHLDGWRDGRRMPDGEIYH